MSKRGISVEQAKAIRDAKGHEETNLQKMRTKKGLSQHDLAVISGVNKRTIQGYESGQRVIDKAQLEILCSLCLALNCGIEDIIEDKNLIDRFKMVKGISK